jgi:hypothetical protein
MPTATKIPGFTADASICNTGTYRHTPVDQGAKRPAVEPALPPGVECWVTSEGVPACIVQTAYQSCVCWNDGSGWDCVCAPRQ